MISFLTEGQIKEYKQMHKSSPAEKRDRIKAILMLNSGYSQAEIAEVLLLDKSTIWRWLNICKSSYKKPRHIPGKGDLEAQKSFVEQYHKLKRERAPKDQIYFMDGVHPLHNCPLILMKSKKCMVEYLYIYSKFDCQEIGSS